MKKIIDIDDSIIKDLKIAAAKNDKSLKKYIENLIRENAINSIAEEIIDDEQKQRIIYNTIMELYYKIKENDSFYGSEIDLFNELTQFKLNYAHNMYDDDLIGKKDLLIWFENDQEYCSIDYYTVYVDLIHAYYFNIKTKEYYSIVTVFDNIKELKFDPEIKLTPDDENYLNPVKYKSKEYFSLAELLTNEDFNWYYDPRIDHSDEHDND